MGYVDSYRHGEAVIDMARLFKNKIEFLRLKRMNTILLMQYDIHSTCLICFK